MNPAPGLEGFGAAKARALEAGQPLSVYLELTYRCNWRCVFCYNPRHSDLEPLSVPEWVAVLDDLRELGTLWLTLTGGEPLAHPKFFEIAAAARARAFALRIFTNGSLIDDSTADQIAALELSGVEMSLHGSTDEVHDRATARPGSLKAMLEGIARLKVRGVPLTLKTPLTRLNEHQLDEMSSLAAKLAIPYKIDPTITPRDDGDLSPLGFRASEDSVRRLYQRLNEIGQLPTADRDEGGVNCGLGRVTMAIDPEGNVYPCMQWRRSALGNVREIPLRRLWRESALRKETAELALTANAAMLAIGGAVASFPFCPALSVERTGEPITPSAEHRELAAIAEQIREAR